MSVSFKDFLESAEALLNNSESKEMDFRNLISRSYYALFHLGKEKSKNLPIPIAKELYRKLGSHEKIIIKFERSSDNYLKRFGREMSQLKTARCKADYDIDEAVVRFEAAQHFHAVKGIIKKLEQLKTTP